MTSSTKHNLADIQHIIAVAAGKGGVGKSTVALNLAVDLQRKGHRVGLMDADLYGPSLRKMWPEQIAPSQHPQQQERIIPAEAGGIKLISMAYFLPEGDPASVRAPIANGIIKQFIHSVEWGELDVLIIDFPPGTGDIQLTLMQESCLTGAVLVTTPQEIALLDVAKALAMFRHLQVPLIGLVENMSYLLAEHKIYPFGQDGGEHFARENGLFFLGQIPLDPQISHCCDAGLSLFQEAAGSPAAEAFAAMTDRVKQQLEAFKKLDPNPTKNFELYFQNNEMIP